MYVCMCGMGDGQEAGSADWCLEPPRVGEVHEDEPRDR